MLSGADTHDIKLLEATLDRTVVPRPELTDQQAQNLCLDAGYTGSAPSIEARNYIPHIRPRGEKRKEIQRNPSFKARHWMVEVTHSFFDHFRKVLVRFEKKVADYLAIIRFASAIIVWRKFINIRH